LTSLSVSLVVYQSDLTLLQQALVSVLDAIAHARAAGCLGAAHIDLIHNAAPSVPFSALVADVSALARAAAVDLHLFEGHGNVGYGRGHNLSIHGLTSDLHLVLNPDVLLSTDSLSMGLQYLQTHAEVVGLSPALRDGAGHKQYGCKRYPAVLDFVLRGFAPGCVQALFRRRLAHYEMQDLPEDAPTAGVPIISGCFMLLRTPALQAVGGFDARYFLYFEDFDLSLRMQTQGSLAYLPSMHVVHLGGHSARKGWHHIRLFVRSGILFYNTHGWRFF
jgi:GT2 family glycosyltransferase